MYEKVGSEYEMFYRYDTDGRLSMVTCRDTATGKRHYYSVVTNAQGDVVNLLGGSGAVRVTYTYDAWGRLVSMTDTSGEIQIGSKNSIRYRGYVYDSETELYYLQSRYYDPETGRFINCDAPDYIGLGDTFTSWNGFAYCENDPVNKLDKSGDFAKWIYNKFKTFKNNIVAIGVQFECVGSALGASIGMGVEFIYFFHLKCWRIYGYTSKSIYVDKGDIKKIVNKAMQQLVKPTNLFKSSVNGSLSVCAVVVYSSKNELFSPSEYKGKFCTRTSSFKNFKSFFSKGSSCFAVGLGGQVSSGLLNLSFSYSESTYFYINEFLSIVQQKLNNAYNAIYNYAKNIINRK